MSIEGWYYLHQNGSLIYKPEHDGCVAGLRDSDFVQCFWPMDKEDRAGAWRILVEALSLGADKDRVLQLAELWSCTDKDAEKYAEYLGVTLVEDGNQRCAQEPGFDNLQESNAGFGDTCLEALADLCKSLGFTAGKMWNATFHDLCGLPSH